MIECCCDLLAFRQVRQVLVGWEGGGMVGNLFDFSLSVYSYIWSYQKCLILNH